MRGIDPIPKTRYSGSQKIPPFSRVTTCCGGQNLPKPHSGVPVVTNLYSGVIVIYSVVEFTYSELTMIT